jgi:hypothetical protein
MIGIENWYDIGRMPSSQSIYQRINAARKGNVKQLNTFTEGPVKEKHHGGLFYFERLFSIVPRTREPLFKPSGVTRHMLWRQQN